MTISATAHPETTPPSVTVTTSITSGYVMSSIAVYRNDHNGRTLLRSQPGAGFDSRTVTDYECPYEENVTYNWAAVYTDPTAYSTVFNETWASLASWTVYSGTANVSGGTVRNTSTFAALYRSVTLGKYRVTIGSMNGSGTTTTDVYLNSVSANTSGDGVRLRVIGGTLTVYVRVGGTVVSTTPTTIDESQPITVDFGTTSVTISGTGGSVVLPYNLSLGYVTLNLIALSANLSVIGAVKVQSYGTPTSVAETSSAVELAPDDAWLIHPGTPDLSVPMTNTNPNAAGIKAIGSVSNDSNTTLHKVLGSSTPIPTTTGPRGDDVTSMTVWTATSDERAAMRALLAPDVPLLIQIPPSWGADFNNGFYQPGEVAEERATGQIRISDPARDFQIPLTKVQSPVVDVENTGWSYASVAVEFSTYVDLTTNFATYADLASNTRV